MQQKMALGALYLSFSLLTGCADLVNQIDLAVYGSPEAAKAANERLAVEMNEQKIKNEQKRLRKYEEELHALISAERAKAKVRVCPINEPMQELARVRAQELAQNFSHIRPNGQIFTTLKDEMPGPKPYWVTTELRRRTFGFSPKAALSDWMGQSKSREVLLRYGAKNYAVGVYTDGDLYYCVFVMGSG